MSIRLRVVDGTLVALCAARSVEREGDVYLDDGQHYALAEKFWRDYPEVGIPVTAVVEALVEQEESNNPGRDAWDRTYGGDAPSRPRLGKRTSVCPCTVVEPCQTTCTCASSVMSGGCLRCATYGSGEQQLAAAAAIAHRLRASETDEPGESPSRAWPWAVYITAHGLEIRHELTGTRLDIYEAARKLNDYHSERSGTP